MNFKYRGPVNADISLYNMPQNAETKNITISFSSAKSSYNSVTH